MKNPRNLTALVLGSLHLAFCALFFGAYFLSPDSERGMALILFWFIDPWIRFFATSFSGTLQNEVMFAAAVTVVGTGLWWCAGWLAGCAVASIFGAKKEPFQPPQRNAGSRPSSSDSSASETSSSLGPRG